MGLDVGAEMIRLKNVPKGEAPSFFVPETVSGTRRGRLRPYCASFLSRHISRTGIMREGKLVTGFGSDNCRDYCKRRATCAYAKGTWSQYD